MLDALICATSEGDDINGSNIRWKQSFFNGKYTSSIFVSQDPIAIDCNKEEILRSLAYNVKKPKL